MSGEDYIAEIRRQDAGKSSMFGEDYLAELRRHDMDYMAEIRREMSYIPEIRREMDYAEARYDREVYNGVFSPLFPLGTFSYQKEEDELSQLTADNAQSEDHTGAVTGTDEDECRAIPLVHDTKPPSLDGRVVSKQAETVMFVKDPTSRMAIVASKFPEMSREIRRKLIMRKAYQRYRERKAQQMDANTAVVRVDGCE